MKKFILISLVLILFLAACGSSDTPETVVDEVETVVADTAVPPEPTAEPIEPTTAPTTPSIPADINDDADLVGLWDGSLAGEHGFMIFADDGAYYLGLSQDDVLSAPRVTGSYWIEDGQFHMQDVTNAGHWTACADEGVYGTAVDPDGTLQFITIDDPCTEGGFTRNYVMENVLWTRIGNVPTASMPEDASEDMAEAGAIDGDALVTALQEIADAYVGSDNAGVVLMVDMPDKEFMWKGAAGMADPATDLAMIADDQFIISSETKMFTAVTIMKLVEAGLLNLDDPIATYLPANLVAQIHVLDGQSFGEEITVRQLLNHTSGLGDFSNGVDVNGNDIPDFKELILAEPDTMWNTDMVLAWAIENAPPVAQPGEQFFYSDTNYQLLAQIIESVTGMSLAEAYRQMIFEPLNMDHTYFEFGEDVVPGVNGRSLSHAFYNGIDWNSLDSHSYEYGSGGIVSTVDDQNRFLWAFVHDELFADTSSKEAMINWGTAEGCGAYYGLGMYNIVYAECDFPGLGSVQGHSGLFNSQAFYWPEQNATIIGTLNANNPALGFISMMLDTMFAIQEVSAE